MRCGHSKKNAYSWKRTLLKMVWIKHASSGFTCGSPCQTGICNCTTPYVTGSACVGGTIGVTLSWIASGLCPGYPTTCSWIQSGLPSWITWNGSIGAFSGTPTANGIWYAQISAVNACQISDPFIVKIDVGGGSCGGGPTPPPSNPCSSLYLYGGVTSGGPNNSLCILDTHNVSGLFAIEQNVRITYNASSPVYNRFQVYSNSSTLILDTNCVNGTSPYTYGFIEYITIPAGTTSLLVKNYCDCDNSNLLGDVNYLIDCP